MARVNVSNLVSTSAVSLTPLARVLRTILQTVIAYGTSFLPLVAGLHLSASRAAEVGAIVAGIVAVASTIQNTLEHLNILPVVGGKVASNR